MSEDQELYVTLEFDDEEIKALEAAAALLGMRVDQFILFAARKHAEMITDRK
ncbi:MAG: hypothetical protein WD081_03785 [Gammaproteobacteria bacterium]